MLLKHVFAGDHNSDGVAYADRALTAVASCDFWEAQHQDATKREFGALDRNNESHRRIQEEYCNRPDRVNHTYNPIEDLKDDEDWVLHFTLDKEMR